MGYREDIETLCSILAAVPGLVYLAQLTNSVNLPSGTPELTSGIGTILVAIFSLYSMTAVAKRLNWSGIRRDAAIQSLGEIEGCIETGGVVWKGIAQLQNGRVEDIDLLYKPMCPRCQTGLVDPEDETYAAQHQSSLYNSKSQSTPVLRCPNDDCKYNTERNPDDYDRAKLLFERHAKRITETRDEDYSLRNLVESIDGAVTPQSIWEKYAEVVSDTQVSTNCFH